MLKVWNIHESELKSEQAKQSLNEIAEALKLGEVIGMPTETVYGLAADATNDQAINKVFQAKGRPGDNPLIIHIHDVSQLDAFVTHTDNKARLLMEMFWPGPISFILPLKPDALSERATVGLNTVAVRMPKHPVALAVLQHADVPIAAPSANTSGRPSPTRAAHVAHDLGESIYGVIESEVSEFGLESTVLDCTSTPFRILRPGAISQKQIETVLNEPVQIDDTHTDKPASPGMKYQHYAPHQQVNVVQEWDRIELPKNAGVIAPATVKQYIREDVYFIALCEDEFAYQEAAQNLYHALREMDDSSVNEIYIHGFNKNDDTVALNNRIFRAAGIEQ